MKQEHLATLEKIGLSTAEAEIYLALTRAGAPMSASAIVTATGVPRGSIYPTLSALTDKGLVEAEPGYGGRFSAVPAERALPFLIKREKEELIERENLAGVLANELKSEGPGENALASEVIQILKDPRVVAERFERLEHAAKQQIDVFVKAPVFLGGGNPAEEKSLQRGVRNRAIYERAILDQPNIKPYLGKWMKDGEEMRVYEGELPHKLAIFDSEIVLMPLIRPHEQTKTVVIRHPQLAQTLTVAFNHFWEQSQPIISTEKPKSFDLATGRNGRQRLRRKKQPNA
jgi:HTH-type transcriptional regulator, sugar sensing transcriptional regulator